MAKFTSYARPGGFNPIQVPDETNKYLNQGNNAIQSLKQAAAFDIAEKNRQLSALNKNNQLEASNRQFVFQRDMENRQRVQQAILGNYQISAQNAETQAINQANFYKQLGNFSSAAVQAATEVTTLVRNAQQERFDKAVLESGADPIQLRAEWAKLGKNTGDEVLLQNPYFQELIHNNGITTNQIRYLGENSTSGKFARSRAVAEAVGERANTYLIENEGKQFDVNGQQISLAQARDAGDLAATKQVMSLLKTDFYRENIQPAGFPTAVQQQYINPYIRAAENAVMQSASAKYRSETDKQLENEKFLVREQALKDGGGQALALKSSSYTGIQRSVSVGEDFKHLATIMRTPGRELEGVELLKQYNATEVLKDGKLQKMGDIFAGRAEAQEAAQEAEKALDAAHNRQLKKIQRKQNQVYVLEDQLITQFQPQTADEVEKIYDILRDPNQGGMDGYVSTRLENILKNETTEAKALVEMDKHLERLVQHGLVTSDELDRIGAPLSLRTKYSSIAAAADKERQLNGNFTAQNNAIENAVKGLPGVIKGPNSALHWTVDLKISQLQSAFRTRMATLRGAGDTDPMLADKVAASIIKEFQANPNNIMKGKEFGGFSDILNMSGAGGRSTGRARHVFDGLRQAGEENRSNTFLDKDGSVYTVSELKEIIKASKVRGWKPDALAMELAGKLNVSPLTVINRQIAARKDPTLPFVTLPEQAAQYETGIRPEFARMLRDYQTSQISTRAMGSTGTYNPITVPKRLGYDIGQLILDTATKYNLPPGLLAGVLDHESIGFKEEVLTGAQPSPSGALGIAQFMPDTAAEMGVDPLNIPQAIDGAARYLIKMLNHPNNPRRSLNWAIQAYNSGPGAVGQSQENREYFGKVMNRAYNYGHLQSLQSRATLRPGFIQRTSSYDTGFGWQPVSMQDEKGRPVIMSRDAATAFSQMVQASGGAVRGTDIASSQRTKEKNIAVGGAAGSRHLHGEAIDVHGKTKEWMIKNGPKFGWYLVDYPGSHGGHFEYRGD